MSALVRRTSTEPSLESNSVELRPCPRLRMHGNHLRVLTLRSVSYALWSAWCLRRRPLSALREVNEADWVVPSTTRWRVGCHQKHAERIPASGPESGLSLVGSMFHGHQAAFSKQPLQSWTALRSSGRERARAIKSWPLSTKRSGGPPSDPLGVCEPQRRRGSITFLLREEAVFGRGKKLLRPSAAEATE